MYEYASSESSFSAALQGDSHCLDKSLLWHTIKVLTCLEKLKFVSATPKMLVLSILTVVLEDFLVRDGVVVNRRDVNGIAINTRYYPHPRILCFPASDPVLPGLLEQPNPSQRDVRLDLSTNTTPIDDTKILFRATARSPNSGYRWCKLTHALIDHLKHSAN